MQKAVKFSN